MTALKKIFVVVIFAVTAWGLCHSKEHNTPEHQKNIKLFKCTSDVKDARHILIFNEKYMVYKDVFLGLEINGLISISNDTLKMRPEYIVGKRGDEIWIDNHLYHQSSEVTETTDKISKNHVYSIIDKSDKILCPPIDTFKLKEKLFLIKNNHLIELFEINISSCVYHIQYNYDLVFQE